MKRLINNLVYLSRIGVLVKTGQLTSPQARLIEGAVYTFEFGVLTFLYDALQSGNFLNWKATLVILCGGFAKTILEGIMSVIRNKMKERQAILDTVVPEAQG